MDYLVNVDGAKAGLWQGFFVTLHGETRYGDALGFNTGAIMPSNTAELFPVPTGTETALTAVKFTQALSEDNIAVTRWFHLTPDLQVLVPARERTLPPGSEAIDTALVVGLRAKIDF